jgi:diguanylate cyclase (GGDEF)-like protein/PAS domain S-box-containing protein
MRALAFLGVSLIGAAAVCLRLDSATMRDAGWLLVGAMAAAAVFVGARMTGVDDRWSWRLVGIGQLLVAGGACADLIARVLDRPEPYPAPADALAVLGCATLGVGILLVMRGQDAARSRLVVIDSVVVTGAGATAAWVLLVEPHVGAVRTAPLTALTVAGMFVALVSLGLAVCTAVLLRSITPATAGIAAGGALLVASVPWAAIGGLGAPYPRGGALAIVWLAALCLIGAAALDPSMDSVGVGNRELDSHLSRAWLAGLVSLALVPASMLVVEAVRAGHLGMLAAVAASVALVVLVVLRLGDVLELQRSAIQREHVIGAGAARLAAVRSHEELEAVATETARGLVGRKAWVVFGDKPLPPEALEGRRFKIVINGDRAGEIAVSAGRVAPDHVRSLQRLASQVAHAIEGVKLVEQRATERATGQSEARFRSLVQNSSDLIAVVDEEGSFTYLAPSVQAVLGFEAEELIGVRFAELLHTEEKEAIESALAAAKRSTGTCTLELRLRRRDATWCRLEAVVSNLLADPSLRGLVITGHDVTQRRELEEQLSHQAFHDPLTSLANRALFLDRVSNALERSRRTFLRVAVLFIDIDDFKTVNDSLGHAAGDELLVGVAACLRDTVRDADAVARLGGDEFAVLFEGVDAGQAEIVATRLLESLDRPVVVEGTEIFPRASIGIALGGAGASGSSLLREADAAMYDAKSAGKSRYSIFRPELHAAANEALALKADLIRAISSNELEVRYQPIVRLATGEIAAFEALTRWQHEERGAISPAEFIPLAEETGVIVDLGRLVLRRACQALADLRRTVPSANDMRVTVNVSSRQLHGTSIVEDVREALGESGIEPRALTLELTESSLVRDVDDSVERLRELKELGVRLAIDDFGTGFSSLAYLQRFPVDVLKIAREFVQEIGSDEEKARVASAVVRLGSTLSLDVIAEGIETTVQRDQLLALECGFGQGFLFAKPLSYGELVAATMSRLEPMRATA